MSRLFLYVSLTAIVAFQSLPFVNIPIPSSLTQTVRLYWMALTWWVSVAALFASVMAWYFEGTPGWGKDEDE